MSPVDRQGGEGKPISILRGRKPNDHALGACDWGDCDEYAVEWRWDDDGQQWLPVCEAHRVDV